MFQGLEIRRLLCTKRGERIYPTSTTEEVKESRLYLEDKADAFEKIDQRFAIDGMRELEGRLKERERE